LYKFFDSYFVLMRCL